MSRGLIEDLLSGSDEDEEAGSLSIDDMRLRHLLDDLDDENAVSSDLNSDENINDLISSLELEDADRLLSLESIAAPELPPQTLSSSAARLPTVTAVPCHGNNERNLIDCFDRQTSQEIQSNDLEWDDEATESLDGTPADVATLELLVSGQEEEEAAESEGCDALQMKERLSEIDLLLGASQRDLSDDRSDQTLLSSALTDPLALCFKND
jgi:hypothetical protein